MTEQQRDKELAARAKKVRGLQTGRIKFVRMHGKTMRRLGEYRAFCMDQDEKAGGHGLAFVATMPEGA